MADVLDDFDVDFYCGYGCSAGSADYDSDGDCGVCDRCYDSFESADSDSDSEEVSAAGSFQTYREPKQLQEQAKFELTHRPQFSLVG